MAPRAGFEPATLRLTVAGAAKPPIATHTYALLFQAQFTRFQGPPSATKFDHLPRLVGTIWGTEFGPFLGHPVGRATLELTVPRRTDLRLPDRGLLRAGSQTLQELNCALVGQFLSDVVMDPRPPAGLTPVGPYRLMPTCQGQ